MIYVPVGYDVDIDKVESILKSIKKEIEKNADVKEMSLLGIDEFKNSFVSYAVIVECATMTHFGVKRQVLRLIKKEFDKEGILIPYNQLDVHIEK